MSPGQERYHLSMSSTNKPVDVNTRPAFARWPDDTNDITCLFLSACKMPDTINIAGGLPEPSVYPVAEVAEFASRAISLFGNETLNYGPIEELPALRDQIASRFSVDGLQFSSDNLPISTGGMRQGTTLHHTTE